MPKHVLLKKLGVNDLYVWIKFDYIIRGKSRMWENSFNIKELAFLATLKSKVGIVPNIATEPIYLLTVAIS